MALEFDTAGFTLKYAIEATAGTRPTTGYTEIKNIVSLNDINLQQNTADVTTIDETVAHRYIETLPDTGGTYTLTANATTEFQTAWQTLRTAAQTGWTTGKRCWFEVVFPADSGYTDSFYFAGQPGPIGLGAINVGEAYQVEMSLVINEIEGLAAAST